MLPDYIIVRCSADNMEQLSYLVQQRISSGYLPQGGPFCIEDDPRHRRHTEIGQAMLRTDESALIAEAIRDSLPPPKPYTKTKRDWEQDPYELDY